MGAINRENTPLVLEDRRTDAQSYLDMYGKVKAPLEPLQTRPATFGFGGTDEEECPLLH